MIFKPLILLFILGSAYCQSYGSQKFEQQVDGRTNYDTSGSQENEENFQNSVEGEGVPEPPAVVPQTSFTCEDKPYQPGMYADLEVDCTVYHMCFDGRKESFLCGTGTVFNQEILSCDHPQNVDCQSSPSFYSANTELGKPGAEPGSGGQPPPRPPTRPSTGGVPPPRPPTRPSTGGVPPPRPPIGPRPPVPGPGRPYPPVAPPSPIPQRPDEGGYGTEEGGYQPDTQGPDYDRLPKPSKPGKTGKPGKTRPQPPPYRPQPPAPRPQPPPYRPQPPAPRPQPPAPRPTPPPYRPQPPAPRPQPPAPRPQPPAPRPQPPAPRPQPPAPRPQPPPYRPQPPAPRPQPPAPRPQPPPYRPPSPSKPSKVRPPKPGKPGPRPRPLPRPVQPERPVVQVQEEANLDYEPSAAYYIQERPGAPYVRASNPSSLRKWQIMSQY